MNANNSNAMDNRKKKKGNRPTAKDKKAAPKKASRAKPIDDSRLKSVRVRIQSQPTAAHSSLTDLALSMLQRHTDINARQASLRKYTDNEDKFPQAFNYKLGLSMPELIKNDQDCIDLKAEMEKTLLQAKQSLRRDFIKLEWKRIHALTEERIATFIKNTMEVALVYATYHRVGLPGTDTNRDPTYAAVALYLYFDSLPDQQCKLANGVLGTTKQLLKERIKAEYLDKLKATEDETAITIPAIDELNFPAPEMAPNQPEEVAVNQPATTVFKAADIDIMKKIFATLHTFIPPLVVDLKEARDQITTERRKNAIVLAASKKRRAASMAADVDATLAKQEPVTHAFVVKCVQEQLNLKKSCRFQKRSKRTSKKNL